MPLNPRHAATFDLLRQTWAARVGIEMFYTGRQATDDDPFRGRGSSHVLIDWGIGSSRVFINVENLGDVRQTLEDSLVRPVRGGFDGRWTVDPWVPLEGRTVNGESA